MRGFTGIKQLVMKLRFLKNHLDYKEGKDYNVPDGLGKYLVGVKAAKEVVAKDGEPIKVAEKKAIVPTVKTETKTVAKAKVKPEAKKEVTPIEDPDDLLGLLD